MCILDCFSYLFENMDDRMRTEQADRLGSDEGQRSMGRRTAQQQLGLIRQQHRMSSRTQHPCDLTHKPLVRILKRAVDDDLPAPGQIRDYLVYSGTLQR